MPFAVASFAAVVSLAERIAVQPLAASTFADAEASTNVVISAWRGTTKTIVEGIDEVCFTSFPYFDLDNTCGSGRALTNYPYMED